MWVSWAAGDRPGVALLQLLRTKTCDIVHPNLFDRSVWGESGRKAGQENWGQATIFIGCPGRGQTACLDSRFLRGFLGVKMKMKAGNRRGCGYSLPLPIALLFGTALFFAGYYISLTNQENASEKEKQETQRLRLLENGLEFAFEHGASGEDAINDIPFQVLSWEPRALIFPRFATKEQCNRIIDLAKTRLAPSGLALRKGESAATATDIRTSSGTFLAYHQDKSGTLELIEEKMSKATMIPRKNGEAFNVLRYQIGQKYNSHYDVFNPAEYGPQKTQRIASMLLYLSDVEEGGETMFPFESYQNRNINYDYKSCIGFKVKPRQGDALLFYSIHPNGTFDAAALHGSCPVIKGEKWVATKWMRDNTF